MLKHQIQQSIFNRLYKYVRKCLWKMRDVQTFARLNIYFTHDYMYIFAPKRYYSIHETTQSQVNIRSHIKKKIKTKRKKAAAATVTRQKQ